MTWRQLPTHDLVPGAVIQSNLTIRRVRLIRRDDATTKVTDPMGASVVFQNNDRVWARLPEN